VKKIGVVVGLIGLVLDQLIKIFFVSNFEVMNNFGVALGVGSGLSWRWLLLGLVIVVAYWFRKSTGGLVIVFGGVSNLIDRFRVGYVIDYLDFFAWFKFNLADGLIAIGVLGMVYNLVYGNKKDI